MSDKEERNPNDLDGWDPNALPDEEAERQRKKQEREERRRREHEKRHAESGGTGFQELAAEEEEVSAQALTVSARRAAPPWKISMYVAVAGIVLAVILLIAQNVLTDGIPSPGNFPVQTILLVFVVFSVVFSVITFATETYVMDQMKGLIGIVLSLVLCVLVYAAVVTDPSRQQRNQSEDEQEMRLQMNQQQLQQWREERLRRNR